MITYVTGDLFTTPGLYALAHGVNCVGVMGKGIAAQFKARWPAMHWEYQRVCRRGDLAPGGIHVWRMGGRPKVYNLATQKGLGAQASLVAIREAMVKMLQHAEANGVKRIGMPRVGCGIGGLAWADVGLVIADVAQRSPVEIVAVSLPGDQN